VAAGVAVAVGREDGQHTRHPRLEEVGHEGGDDQKRPSRVGDDGQQQTARRECVTPAVPSQRGVGATWRSSRVHLLRFFHRCCRP